MEALRSVVLLSYLVVVAELVFLPVPSEASLRNRWSTGTPGSRLSIALHGIRIAASCAGFLVPAVWLAAPGAAHLLVPLFVPGSLWAATPITLGVCFGLSGVVSVRTAKRRGELATGGPFRWSRNPMLAGLYLHWMGLFVAVPSPFVLVGFAVCAVHMDRRVRVEEEYLTRIFGDGYQRYAATVYRYIGRRRGDRGFALRGFG